MFEGHIACDADARSEIVVPLFLPGGALLGVLDIDSTLPDRFSGEDEAGAEALAQVFLSSID